MLEITIEYKLVADPQRYTLTLSPAEYFDVNPRFPVAKFEVTSVPLYFHAIEYLPFDSSQVEFTVLMITNSENNTKRIVSETFWDHGKSRIIERRDTELEGESWLMIMDVRTSDSPETQHIFRLERENNLVQVKSHFIEEKKKDGTLLERHVFPEPKK